VLRSAVEITTTEFIRQGYDYIAGGKHVCSFGSIENSWLALYTVYLFLA
jgi:hypothetical protein